MENNLTQLKNECELLEKDVKTLSNNLKENLDNLKTNMSDTTNSIKRLADSKSDTSSSETKEVLEKEWEDYGKYGDRTAARLNRQIDKPGSEIELKSITSSLDENKLILETMRKDESFLGDRERINALEKNNEDHQAEFETCKNLAKDLYAAKEVLYDKKGHLEPELERRFFLESESSDSDDNGEIESNTGDTNTPTDDEDVKPSSEDEGSSSEDGGVSVDTSSRNESSSEDGGVPVDTCSRNESKVKAEPFVTGENKYYYLFSALSELSDFINLFFF